MPLHWRCLMSKLVQHWPWKTADVTLLDSNLCEVGKKNDSHYYRKCHYHLHVQNCSDEIHFRRDSAVSSAVETMLILTFNGMKPLPSKKKCTFVPSASV
jgi:hypothetical protein